MLSRSASSRWSCLSSPCSRLRRCCAESIGLRRLSFECCGTSKREFDRLLDTWPQMARASARSPGLGSIPTESTKSPVLQNSGLMARSRHELGQVNSVPAQQMRSVRMTAWQRLVSAPIHSCHMPNLFSPKRLRLRRWRERRYCGDMSAKRSIGNLPISKPEHGVFMIASKCSSTFCSDFAHRLCPISSSVVGRDVAVASENESWR